MIGLKDPNESVINNGIDPNIRNLSLCLYLIKIAINNNITKAVKIRFGLNIYLNNVDENPISNFLKIDISENSGKCTGISLIFLILFPGEDKINIRLSIFKINWKKIYMLNFLIYIKYILKMRSVEKITTTICSWFDANKVKIL